ncbi:Transcription elongation factor GreB [Gammaproteobacteria bacterium]|nr:transcription elongation factor GreB [Gammaproteobacteria bacterium]QOJ31044.1 MAG: transcription elongation factor GreB [Gammaproteobacteria bacterium]CAG0938507.1 Transcription elongation factor GreB [Gammaproteobacteria bacterium]
MGRWKPPQPRSSPHITPAGYAALEAELAALWQRRAGVVTALAAAAAEGDRSENAEYLYRKRELAGIDRRIRYLQKRLPELQVVRQAPPGGRVFFGARVRLWRGDDTEVEYRIVGADETDAATGGISIDSPLARALLKKAVDDEVEVHVPGGIERYVVLAVRYD